MVGTMFKIGFINISFFLLKTILAIQCPFCFCYLLELKDNFLLKMDRGR